jgi:hypothetical protein
VDNKYLDNEVAKKKYKENLKITLDKYIEKIKNPDKKGQLIYLKEIL